MRLLLLVCLTFAVHANPLSHDTVHATGVVHATIDDQHHVGGQERCLHPLSALGATCSASAAVLLPSYVLFPIMPARAGNVRLDVRDDTDAGCLVLPPVPPPRA